jgi:hypothetical protein
VAGASGYLRTSRRLLGQHSNWPPLLDGFCRAFSQKCAHGRADPANMSLWPSFLGEACGGQPIDTGAGHQ